MTIIMYKGCMLTNKYNDVFETSAILETYLATLDGTNFTIPSSYFDLQGDFPLSGTPINYNYAKCVDQNNKTWYMFITDYIYRNGATVYHYILDVWHTYIDGYGSEWFSKNGHRVMCATNRDYTCSLIAKPQVPILSYRDIAINEGNPPVSGSMSGGYKSTGSNDNFVLFITGYKYSAVNDNGEISQGIPFNIMSAMCYQNDKTGDTIFSGIDSGWSLTPYGNSFNKMLRVAQYFYNKITAASIVYASTTYYFAITNIQLVPIWAFENLASSSYGIGGEQSTGGATAVTSFKNGDNHILFLADDLDGTFDNLIYTIDESSGYIGYGVYSAYSENLIGYKDNYTLETEDLYYYNTTSLISKVAIGCLGNLVEIPNYANYLGIETNIAIGFNCVNINIVYNGNIIDITENLIIDLNYNAENRISAYTRELARKQAKTQLALGIVGATLSTATEIGSAVVTGGTSLALSQTRGRGYTKAKRMGYAAEAGETAINATGNILSSIVDTIGSIANYNYARQQQYSEVSDNTASDVLSGQTGITVLYGTPINTTEVSATIAQYGYNCDIFESSFIYEFNSAGFDTLLYDSIELYGLPNNILENIYTILTKGVRVHNS